MAHHKSCKKRVRQNVRKTEQNKWFAKTMRNAIRAIRSTSDKKEASEKLNQTISLIDKVARRNQIHKNKAANLKSGLTKYVNSL